jgi:hypothetical protein
VLVLWLRRWSWRCVMEVVMAVVRVGVVALVGGGCCGGGGGGGGCDGVCVRAGGCWLCKCCW